MPELTTLSRPALLLLVLRQEVAVPRRQNPKP
jgi:hypothetical protein